MSRRRRSTRLAAATAATEAEPQPNLEEEKEDQMTIPKPATKSKGKSRKSMPYRNKQTQPQEKDDEEASTAATSSSRLKPRRTRQMQKRKTSKRRKPTQSESDDDEEEQEQEDKAETDDDEEEAEEMVLDDTEDEDGGEEDQEEVIIVRESRSRRGSSAKAAKAAKEAEAEATTPSKKRKRWEDEPWKDVFYERIREEAERATGLLDEDKRDRHRPYEGSSIGDGRAPNVNEAKHFTDMTYAQLKAAVRTTAAQQCLKQCHIADNLHFNNGNMSAALSGKYNFKGQLMRVALSIWCAESSRLGLRVVREPKPSPPSAARPRTGRRSSTKRGRGRGRRSQPSSPTHSPSLSCSPSPPKRRPSLSLSAAALSRFDIDRYSLTIVSPDHDMHTHIRQGFGIVNIAKDDHEHVQVAAFKSGVIEQDDAGGSKDYVLNVGGSVSCIEWAPVGNSDVDASVCSQYLAVCANTHQTYHRMDARFEGDHIIQIWDFGVCGSGSSPSLALSVLHDGGCVYQAKWCPAPAASQLWQSPCVNDDDSNANTYPRLGVLACVCGDGCVRVLSIPHPKSINNIQEARPVVVRLRSVLSSDGLDCVCLSWAIYNNGIFLLSGTSKGQVAFWDLSSSSASTKPDLLLTCVDSNPSSIRWICWSPNLPLFGVCTESGHVLTYDVRYPFVPVFSTRFSRGPIMAIEFSDVGGTLLVISETGARSVHSDHSSKIPYMLRDSSVIDSPASNVEMIDAGDYRCISVGFDDGTSVCSVFEPAEDSGRRASQRMSFYPSEVIQGKDAAFCACSEDHRAPDNHVFSVRFSGPDRLFSKLYDKAKTSVPPSASIDRRLHAHTLLCDRIACSSTSLNANLVDQQTYFASGYLNGIVRCQSFSIYDALASIGV